uniref:Uncharacterized protein n=1 Tax=Cacopsylla melanoneura TaxID=428564 RepID=A0A8D8W9C0_9HEMI
MVPTAYLPYTHYCYRMYLFICFIIYFQLYKLIGKIFFTYTKTFFLEKLEHRSSHRKDVIQQTGRNLYFVTFTPHPRHEMIHSHKASIIFICIWIISLLIIYQTLCFMFLLISHQSVSHIIDYVRNKSLELEELELVSDNRTSVTV